MSSTPFICCSSGVATDCSMVTASAPGYCAVTVICGGTIEGNWATGRSLSATRPPSTVTIAMTIATIGRRMKKRDMSVALRRPRVDRRAVANGRGVDDHAIAGLQPLLDDPSAADPRPELYGAHGDVVVALGDPQLIAGLELGYGTLRHQQHLLAHRRLGADASVLTRPEHVAGIGKQGADPDRAHLRIHLAIDRLDAPLARIHRAVGEHQVQPAARLPQ